MSKAIAVCVILGVMVHGSAHANILNDKLEFNIDKYGCDLNTDASWCLNAIIRYASENNPYGSNGYLEFIFPPRNISLSSPLLFDGNGGRLTLTGTGNGVKLRRWGAE